MRKWFERTPYTCQLKLGLISSKHPYILFKAPPTFYIAWPVHNGDKINESYFNASVWFDLQYIFPSWELKKEVLWETNENIHIHANDEYKPIIC